MLTADYPLFPPHNEGVVVEGGCDLFVTTMCEQVVVELKAPSNYMLELIVAFYGRASLFAKALCKISVFYETLQRVSQIGGPFAIYKEAVDSIGDNILAAAHACGYAGQAARHCL